MASYPDALGERLYRAYRDAEPIDSISLPAKLTVEEGYAAQDAFLDHRISDEGEPVGYKIGFTNKAVQADLDSMPRRSDISLPILFETIDASTQKHGSNRESSRKSPS